MRMSEWVSRWVMMWAMVAALLLPGMAHAVGYGDVLLGDSRADVARKYALKPVGKDVFEGKFDAYETIMKTSDDDSEVTLVFDKNDRLNAIYMFLDGASLDIMSSHMSSRFPVISNVYFSNKAEAVVMDGGDGRILLAQAPGKLLFNVVAEKNYIYSVILLVVETEHAKFHKE